MIYQHSKSMNRIVSGAKKHSFIRDTQWKFKTWARKHINLCRISLSNKYFVSLSITHYQAFFPFVWLYFGLVYIAWAFSMILYPIFCLRRKNITFTSSNSVLV